MANCPKCQAELLQDSGLVLCPSCGHPSVLDFNGNIVESVATAQPTAPAPIAAVSTPTAPTVAVNDGQEVSQIAVLELTQMEGKDPSSGFSLFQSDAPPPVEISQNDPFANLQPGTESLNISEYANSEFSQGKDGAFVYNVSISDIDSKEIREFLREAINDTRFNWDAQAIIAQIKKGELLLKNLSPVKASILINRIKRLPVKIRWDQYAITQAEQNSSAP